MIDASNDDHPEFYRIEYDVKVTSGVACKNLKEVYDRLPEIENDPTVDKRTIKIIKNQRVETRVTDAEIKKANKDRLRPADRPRQATKN